MDKRVSKQKPRSRSISPNKKSKKGGAETNLIIDENANVLINPFMLFCMDFNKECKRQNKEFNLKEADLKWDLLSQNERNSYINIFDENKKLFDIKKEEEKSKKINQHHHKKSISVDKKVKKTLGKKSLTKEVIPPEKRK